MTLVDPSQDEFLTSDVRARLGVYLDLLKKWNASINLVSPATLAEAWTRHFLDSAQLLSLSPSEARSWLDLGSGGGFPGMVIACLAQRARPEMKVELVEADQRKCAFLRAVARELALDVRVTCSRIEDLAPRGAAVVSARALAPLETLFALSEPHLAPGGLCLFLKGRQAEGEISAAERRFRFAVARIASRTDTGGLILKVTGLRHV